MDDLCKILHNPILRQVNQNIFWNLFLQIKHILPNETHP